MQGWLRASEGGVVQEERFLTLAGGAAIGGGRARGVQDWGAAEVVAAKAGQ
jgi:hypothetical protein